MTENSRPAKRVQEPRQSLGARFQERGEPESEAAPPESQANALGPARLIINPVAGNGRVSSLLPQLTTALAHGGLEFDIATTNTTEHTSELARTALDDGVRYLIAVGGDGTVHHVVNGMFDGRTPVAQDAVLGVCAAGTGSDFVRNFGLDRPVDVIARHLLSPSTMLIDVGVVQFTDFDGNQTERLFANIAEAGYGAEVVRRVARFPKRLGRLRYLFAAWASMARMPRATAEIAVDFTTRTLPLVELVAANGQFFGGGMKVAPRAIPQDGRLSVLAFTGNRSQVFLLTTKLFAGEHLPHPEIVEYQSSMCSVSTDEPLLVEADGELLGTTPARFSMLKRTLQLKI
jgi:diacylglycerol kinase (ATP)